MADSGSTIATSVDEYEPSLWHVIGQYAVRYALIMLVDSFHNNVIAGRYPKLPIVLLTGTPGMGRRHIAQALHHAFGNNEWREPAHILGTSEDPVSFWTDSTESTTYFIPNLNCLSNTSLGQLIHAIRDGYFFSSYPVPINVITAGSKLIILSAEPDDPVCDDLMRYVTLRCNLYPYVEDHIYQILRQRVNGLNWTASDESLRLIAQSSNSNPGKAMTTLQYSYMVLRAEDRENSINVNHAKKAVSLNS